MTENECEYLDDNDPYDTEDDHNEDPCIPCRLMACEYWGGDGLCLLELHAEELEDEVEREINSEVSK